MLSCEFCEISKNTFFIEHLRWLLLSLRSRVLVTGKYKNWTSKQLWTTAWYDTGSAIRSMLYVRCGKSINTLYLISNSWSAILLSFYFTEAMSHNFVLTVELWPSKRNCVIYFSKSSLKMMKNTFYFILKAPFVPKIFKFLSRLFGHVGKTAWLKG